MSIALYRRYRPEIFEEVIGQDHVIEPLMAALEAGRTTHAYLFSGPRGCGKTTSARILARALNCAEYPTPTPCGECESCRELARDGSGSLDVVELDAASHGGVDDARELREQASFAPVRDRFKIFIIDEAHMVTTQGFNALLKLVEEPPAHVKFIFATTEPEKVIGTIRSRTHHYPFRLVPPPLLEEYLGEICHDEGIDAPREVLSLVVRAGTGSVRDTLSVLDQIIGGSDGVSLDYDRAVALLGYTSAHLLDDTIIAISHNDGPALFQVVDSIVASGHDPRRFVEDLLQRLRDLVILSLAGESAREVFVQVPDDQFAAMIAQAGLIGAKRASLCADFANETLTTMVGATAPRLQLELLCARLLVQTVPNAGAGTGSGVGAGNAADTAVSGSAPNPNQIRFAENGRSTENKTGAGVQTAMAKNTVSAAHMPGTHHVSENPLSAPMPGINGNPLNVGKADAAVQSTAVQSAGAAENLRKTANAGREAEQKARIPAVPDFAALPGANRAALQPNTPQPAAAENFSSPDFAKVVQNWGEIMQLAMSKSSAVAAILEHAAGAAALERNVLSIYFANEKQAANFNQTIPALDVVARAVYAKTGLKTRVQGVVARAESKGGSINPKVEAPLERAELLRNQDDNPLREFSIPQSVQHGSKADEKAEQNSAASETSAKTSPDSQPEIQAENSETVHYTENPKELTKLNRPENNDPVGVLRPLLNEVRGLALEKKTSSESGIASEPGEPGKPAETPDSAENTAPGISAQSGTIPQNAETSAPAESTSAAHAPEPVQAQPPRLQISTQTQAAASQNQMPAAADSQPFYRQNLPHIPPADLPKTPAAKAENMPAAVQNPTAERTNTSQGPNMPFSANRSANPAGAAALPAAAAIGGGMHNFSTEAFTGLTSKAPISDGKKNSAGPSLSARLAAHIDASVGETIDPFAALNAQEPADDGEFTGDEWDEVSIYDPSVSESAFVGVNVILEELGGKIIEEIPHGKQNRQ